MRISPLPLHRRNQILSNDFSWYHSTCTYYTQTISVLHTNSFQRDNTHIISAPRFSCFFPDQGCVWSTWFQTLKLHIDKYSEGWQFYITDELLNPCILSIHFISNKSASLFSPKAVSCYPSIPIFMYTFSLGAYPRSILSYAPQVISNIC